MFTTPACENPYILKIILFVSNFLEIFYYLIPIILIIMLSLDFSKNVIFADDQSLVQKNVQKAIKRIIYIIILFLVPSIVSAALDLVENSNTLASNVVTSYNSCKENTQKITYYEKKFNLKVKQEEEKRARRKNKMLKSQNQEEEKRELLAEKLKYKVRNKVNIIRDNSNNNTTSSSSYVGVGKTYNLSDTELKQIANLCQQEQGSEEGAAAEASLMANRYELYGGTGSLATYVRNASWWAKAGYYMDNGSSDGNVVEAVKRVLVNGNRTLPPHVDEHDCWDCDRYHTCDGGFKGDICSLNTNGKIVNDLDGIKNRSNYTQDKTIINNALSSTYTFYSFPTPNSDPFGYTQEAYNKINGSR